VVDEESAKAWFAITPPEGWVPKELPWPIRERIRRAIEAHRRKAIVSAPESTFLVHDGEELLEEYRFGIGVVAPACRH
jgi:hypothetical protein